VQGLPHRLQGAGQLSEDRPPAGAATSARIWDWPTRLVHWAIAVLIPFSWWTATHDQLERHRFSGYVLLGLLLFRLAWGFAGGAPSRFAGFLRGPATVLRYVRGRLPAVPGHNPLGGWSVAAMLAALAAQIALGLVAVDEDGLESGPLSYRVSFATGRWAAKLHHKIFWLIAALVVLHLAAILFYALAKRRNLTAAMISGRAALPEGAEPPTMAPWWRAAVLAVLAGLAAWWVSLGLRL
jgi:cytochrome b